MIEITLYQTLVDFLAEYKKKEDIKLKNYAELNPKWREIQKKYKLPKGQRGESFVSAKPGTKLEKKLARFKEYEEFEGIAEAKELLGPAIVEDRGLELVKRTGKNALSESEIDRIRSALSDNYDDPVAFKSSLSDLDIPDSRLDLIYDSEKHVADGESEVAYARSKGARSKRWNVVYEGNLCEKCAEMDGEEVGIDEPFSNGEMSAHLHPNCRCSLSFEYSGE